MKNSQARKPAGKARHFLAWRRNTGWSDWTALSRRRYFAQFNLADANVAILLKRHTQLTEAKWALRISEGQLETQLFWHQREERVMAHILGCCLAHVFKTTLAQWMLRSVLADASRTLVEESGKIKSGAEVLPAWLAVGSRRTMHLRG